MPASSSSLEEPYTDEPQNSTQDTTRPTLHQQNPSKKRVTAERNTLADRMVAILLVVALIIISAGTYYFSDIRKTHQNINDSSLQDINVDTDSQSIFSDLRVSWRKKSIGDKPLTFGEGVIVRSTHGVSFQNAISGEELWSYTRDNRTLCDVLSAFDKVALIYDGPKGCGDITLIDPSTGRYAAERSSSVPADAQFSYKEDYLTSVSPDRVELWRSDLVRTLEYGHSSTPVSPDTHEDYKRDPGCHFTSALSNSDFLAITDLCPSHSSEKGKAGKDETKSSSYKTIVRLMKPSPKDSSTPEVIKNYEMSADTRIVALGKPGVVVYTSPDGTSGSEKGTYQLLPDEGEVRSYTLPASPDMEKALESQEVYQPLFVSTQDNHIFFNGDSTIVFSSDSMVPETHIPDSIGIGTEVDHKLLVPVHEGINVVDLIKKKIIYTIPLDRGGYSGSVHVSMAGSIIMEQRGEELVALDGTADSSIISS